MSKHKYKLTIAMAEYMDHSGTFFTIQSLRMHHDIEDCEIIVLDNAPHSPDGEATKGFVANANTKWSPVRYIPFADSTGTTQTRQKLFELAEGEAVLVLDCHVLLQANAIHELKKFYATADEQMRKNLFTGPLLMDTLGYHQTHFECVWRDQMWGTWATAWRSPEGILYVGRSHDEKIDPYQQKLEMKVLNTDGPWMKSDINWIGHQDTLVSRGFKLAGKGEDTEPFEIPGQGLGLFSSLRDEWLGFNPDFRSFGGEECYIHEKYRQAGRKTMCLPFLKWNHRFGRPGGPKYPITVEGKMRNYILGFKELGLDLEEVRHHFVNEVGVSPMVWDLVVADPVNYDPLNNKFRRSHPNTGIGEFKPEMKSNFGMPLPVDQDSLQVVAMFLQTVPRDLDKHGAKLIELASECRSIVEFTKRRESTAFLLAGLTRVKLCQQEICQKEGCQGVCKPQPVKMTSFQEERDTLVEMLHEVIKRDNGRPVTWTDIPANLDTPPEMPYEADMVFIDTRHTGERAAQELALYGPKVNKYIVFHDTHDMGLRGEDGKPGILFAIKQFIKDNPQFFIKYHTGEQHGLTVVAKDPIPRPEKPIRPWPKDYGVGTEIKKFFSSIGVNPSATCSCNALAAEFNQKGAQWCEDNIETILDKLHEQYVAQKVWETKKIPWVRIGVKLMVKRAIRAAKKQEAEDQ